MVKLATGASKRLHQSLQPSGRAMKPLARIDFFDFDDTTSTPTYCVDGVDAKPALIDEPRHDQLSHYLPSARAIPTLFGDSLDHCKNISASEITSSKCKPAAHCCGEVRSRTSYILSNFVV
jgi:hypothetical protein